jgi:elongation factor P
MASHSRCHFRFTPFLVKIEAKLIKMPSFSLKIMQFLIFGFIDFHSLNLYFSPYLLTNLKRTFMADTSDFRIGLIIKYKNDLYAITDFQHVKPGKGGAFVRTVLKNVRTGKVLDNTFRSGEGIEIIRVERRKYQYLFREGEFLVCMDNDNYEQINVPVTSIGDGVNYLKEAEEVEILFNGSDIITVDIPIFVNLRVVETEPGFRGDTATGANKPAKLETGATITVPLFVNVDDVLKVDTRIGGYVERVKL